MLTARDTHGKVLGCYNYTTPATWAKQYGRLGLGYKKHTFIGKASHGARRVGPRLD